MPLPSSDWPISWIHLDACPILLTRPVWHAQQSLKGDSYTTVLHQVRWLALLCSFNARQQGQAAYMLRLACANGNQLNRRLLWVQS